MVATLTRFNPSALTELEEIAKSSQLANMQAEGRFARAFAMAAYIRELRTRITPDMMKDIMALQGTPLGFKTDKDRDGGYQEQVVKECLIEATIRGAYPVCNEFNIIAGRCYLTKEFYERHIGELDGITDVKKQPGVPTMKEMGALVPFKVSWKKHGVADSVERIIPVKVNSMMGADAIIGKATRKALKAACEQITGSVMSDPDDELSEGHVANGTPRVSLSDRLAKAATPAIIAGPSEGQTIDTRTGQVNGPTDDVPIINAPTHNQADEGDVNLAGERVHVPDDAGEQWIIELGVNHAPEGMNAEVAAMTVKSHVRSLPTKTWAKLPGEVRQDLADAIVSGSFWK